jgi:hypothetical protein
MRTNEFETVYEDLAALDQMTESEATDFYKTDSKEEARQLIIEYWHMISPDECDYEDYIKRINKLKNKQL